QVEAERGPSIEEAVASSKPRHRRGRCAALRQVPRGIVDNRALCAEVAAKLALQVGPQRPAGRTGSDTVQHRRVIAIGALTIDADPRIETLHVTQRARQRYAVRVGRAEVVI